MSKSVIKNTTAPDYGKLPPQSVELEEAVLGAILLDKNCLYEVNSILSHDDFYKEDHQIIFKTIIELDAFDEPIDILTVSNSLKGSGQLEIIGGYFYIAQLTNRVASSANVEYHARIVLQNSIRRQMIALASQAIKNAYDETEDIFSTMDLIDRTFNEISNKTTSGSIDTMVGLSERLLKLWIEREKTPNGVIGRPTGFKAYDSLIGGYQDGQMIILAGRPGMGKTTVMLQAAKNCAKIYGKKVGIITLEMSSLELFCKLMSNETGIDYKRLMSNTPLQTDYLAINNHMSILNKAGIYIVDRSSMNERELKLECRKLVKEYSVDEIWIDYIQLMQCSDQKGKNRDQELGIISRSIKSTAKLLGIPIIALAQLSRAVETRGGDKRPQMSDLRESGSLEQDADIVTFVYRAEYYNISETPDGLSTHGKVELITAKHRGGNTADVLLSCDLRYSRVSDLVDESVDSWNSLGVSKQYKDDPF